MIGAQFLSKLVLGNWLLSFGGLGNERPQKIENPEICYTPECLQLASTFIASMNQSTDPCVNFYEFACGRWSSVNPIPKYAVKWNSIDSFTLLFQARLRGQTSLIINAVLNGILNDLDELETESTSEDIWPVQQVKQWYKSCMDSGTRESRGLQPINTILRETNGWPMIMSANAWDKSATTWQNIDKYYGHLIGDYAFYNIRLSSSEYFGSEKQGKIDVSTPEFALERNLFKHGRNYSSGNGLLYRSIIKSIAQLFIKENKANVSDNQLEKDIDDLLKFEERLYKASKNYSSSDSINAYRKQLQNVNLSGFIEWWNGRTESIATIPQGKIHWRDVIQGIFDITNLTVPGSSQTTISNIVYLLELPKILQSTDERTIVNYMQWNFLNKILPYTTSEVTDLFYERIRRYNLGAVKRRPRWLECVLELKMEDAAAYLFVKKYYNDYSRKAASEIMSNLRKSFEMKIRKSNWLSNEAKRAATNKLENMVVRIGYPNWYKNTTLFTNHYKDLTIGDNYFENHLNFIKYEKASSLRLFAGAHQNDRWDNSMLIMDAFYTQFLNILTIPGIAFQTPLIAEGIPAYVKYGILGTVIGHEIGHVFDTRGIQFGPNFDYLLTNEMQKIYDERVECFVAMFDNYFKDSDTSQDSSKNVSFSGEESNLTERRKKLSRGRLTIDENLADANGLSAAFRAYKKLINKKESNEDSKLPGFQNYTDEQMFFISFAQAWCATEKPNLDEQKVYEVATHSANNLRVIAAVSNSFAFTRSFHCPKSSPMNLEHKCNLWRTETPKWKQSGVKTSASQESRRLTKFIAMELNGYT